MGVSPHRTEALIQQLALYSRKIVDKGLAAGPGGNTSVRDGSIMWISPSGYTLDEIGEEDWVGVDIESGTSLHPTLRPSSEVAMHLGIYRERKDVQAIIHTHPPVTIGVISSGYDEIPAMFPDIVALVGEIPSIDYVIPCSDELAQEVVRALGNTGYQALLMKNHGLITLGSNVKQAYYRTEIVEDAARIFWIAKSLGNPRCLTADEKRAILDLEAEKYRQKLMEKGSDSG
jgi:L-fuculose-phosphate aldolase